MSSAGRFSLVRDTGVPGPASYNVTQERKGQGVLIKGRHGGHTERISDLPGPSQYSPQSLRNRSPPTWSFAKARRSDISKASGLPGPGNYMLHSEDAKPSWSFGVEKRYKEGKQGLVGPGSYDIKATVPMAPSYLIPYE